MNRKVSKRITRQVKEIIVEWFGTILSEEEASKVTTDNCLEFMPDQTHFYAGRTTYLNAYHPKWISNKIKKMLKSMDGSLLLERSSPYTPLQGA